MTYEIHVGDCLDVLRAMPDNSVDAIVTDPPYGLTSNGGGPSTKGRNTPAGRAQAGASRGGFMGHKWDSDVPRVEIWAECLRVLKPGGHLLAFAGTRTQHRMAVRIEDAGFEIRDMIAWVYGSGFPKSHNGAWGGTALKPALEPITMARKPLAGTVEANWREHGTGALNIDGCRVAPTGESRERVGEASQDRRYAENGGTDFAALPGMRGGDPSGRWPANLIHDGSEDVLEAFPLAKGQQGAVGPQHGAKTSVNAYGDFGPRDQFEPRGDTGSAARFFYCAKASKRDRDEGCQGLPLVDWTAGAPNNARSDQINTSSGKLREAQPSRNHHPTVKPTELMAYLVRLVTPPGGVVLDPFMGSGSTGKACMREGFQFVGCELSADYAAIAKARIEHELRKLAPSSGTQQPGETLPLFEAVAA